MLRSTPGERTETATRLATAAHDRVALLVVLLIGSLLLSALLRLVLCGVFLDDPGRIGTALRALLLGVGRDLPVKLIVLAPLMLWLALGFGRWLRFRIPRTVLLLLLFTAASFQAAVEFYFFDEFDARFNHIAIDYVRHPGEVLGNIHESYDVSLVLLLALIAALPLTWAAARRLRDAQFPRATWRQRLTLTAGSLLILAAAAGALWVMPDGRDPAARVASEITANGLASLVRAARTASLDYPLYYPSLPVAEVETRLTRLQAAQAAQTEAVGSDPASSSSTGPAAWDVVVILEESLGSEFIGVLGHAERKTSPGFDRWSQQGLLLTNLYSTGNRTVRGLEGTLCSLVPLPGDAVLRRYDVPHVATLARVFAGRGYSTTFAYGGWGTFDGMIPFMPNNGFQEMLDRSAMRREAFATVWGVADEYMFEVLLARQLAARQRGERLFATALTVSNHKPYEVPERGTAWPAAKRKRETAVAYADWALANYLDQAQAAGLLEHTLVLVVGDHGARVYGQELIPVHSYRVPALFLVPGSRWDGVRIDRLASQIDLAPTILGLLGLKLETPFMGGDVTRLPRAGGRAFLQHDRSIGLLTDDTLVVLGLKKQITFYRRDQADTDRLTLRDPPPPGSALEQLAHDAIAIYQSADQTLKSGRFRYPLATAPLETH